MIATLVAALSLASSAIDVPYLPQTDALCGGAAVAMVFRYWGDAHADVQEFASLVDRRAGGIANDVLSDAVAKRGWRVGRMEGSLGALTARVRDGQPVIVLVPDRGNRYHYVVVTGVNEDGVIVHDPAWGPSRAIRAPDFERAWRTAKFWSLIIMPPVAPAVVEADGRTPAVEATSTAPDRCDEVLSRALANIREQGFDRAEMLLGEARAQCPNAAGPLGELSGVRFAQHRWADAAALARDALARDPHDGYALDVLGSSLFMQDDEVGALRAWNRIEKPRVNLVRIDGLHHTRYQTIAETLAIQPNRLLTADVFERARRRLGELPDHSAARLAVRPERDGFATVDVVVAERATLPRGRAEWVDAALRAGVDREVGVAVPGTTGQGEVWSANWRWWSHRPGVSIGFAAPRVHGMPGVWRVEGTWRSETYATGETRLASLLTRERRTRAGLTVSDWLTGRVRYGLSAGFDSWNAGRKAASIGGSLERHMLADRLSLSAEASQWVPVAGPAFHTIAARAAARTSTGTQGWVYHGEIGAERAADAAPFGLWPGAGDGHARAPLLRAHPLLDDGVVDLTRPAVIGRTLAYGSAEALGWLERPSLLRVGLAGFVDAALASRRVAPGREPLQIDFGAGLRVKLIGAAGVVRVDIAHGIRDGANALTFGWLFASRPE